MKSERYKKLQLQESAKKGINLSLTVRTDMPKHPGRKGGVPSTARRSSPKLAINERVKRLYPQSSIPNINPFRLKQMTFRIKVCQGCRGPLQSSLGTCHFFFFMFLYLVWLVYIAVEVQFYICSRFIILCFRYVLHGNKLKMKNKS